MSTIKIDDKEYKITGIASDGLPIIQGIATSSQDGFDDDGNPKISVNINVPSIIVGASPGQNG